MTEPTLKDFWDVMAPQILKGEEPHLTIDQLRDYCWLMGTGCLARPMFLGHDIVISTP